MRKGKNGNLIQAIFCDIDGTLLDHSGEKSVFPASTEKALAAAQRKGVKIFVATGRYPATLRQITGFFPFDGFITLNGQLVTLRDGTVIRKAAHDPEDIRRLIPLVHKEGLASQIIEEDRTFPITNSPEITQYYRWAGEPVPPAYDLARLEDHPVLQILLHLPLEEGKKVLAPLEHIEVTSAGGDLLDVIPKGGGKEVGIAAAADHLGVPRESIMTFGDGINDVRMLQWAGTGVAMGNAAPEAKAAADYVTTAVWDNGVQNALLHFGVVTEKELEP